jgi:hypothetical protein
VTVPQPRGRAQSRDQREQDNPGEEDEHDEHVLSAVEGGFLTDNTNFISFTFVNPLPTRAPSVGSAS